MNINSLKSYSALKYSGQLGKTQREVLDFVIERKSVTAFDVVNYYGETHRKRIKELCDKKLIKKAGTRYCHHTNREVAFYQVNTWQEDLPIKQAKKPTRRQLEAQIKELKEEMAKKCAEQYDKGFTIGANLAKTGQIWAWGWE